MKIVTVEGRSVAPGKILCIGRNFVDHIQELGNELPEDMVVFGKPNSAIADGLRSFHGEPLHYEGEICLLLEKGKAAYVGFGLDITKRELQRRLKDKGLPWERSKAFDDSALFSPFVALVGALEDLRLELRVDGQLVQQGAASNMIYRPEQAIKEIASFTSWTDGDILMTGTPKGVGEIRSGARFEGLILSGEKELVRGAWVAS